MPNLYQQINYKQAQSVSKVLYSQGYNIIFTISAYSYAEASARGFQNLIEDIPVFVFTASTNQFQQKINQTVIAWYEMQALLKLIVIKEVLPSYTGLSYVRCFDDFAKFCIFPFVQLYIPISDANDTSNDLSSRLQSE